MISYRRLFEKSQELLSFLDLIGLKDVAIKGRYGTYTKTTSQLADSFEAGGLDQFFKEVCTAEKSGFQLKELNEFVYILEKIKHLWEKSDDSNKQEIYKRLRPIFDGTTYTEHETPRNSTARNFQHELLITSRFLEGGLVRTSLHDNPDIAVESYGKKYAIECKRVTGNFETASLKRVGEAIDQLYKVSDKYFSGVIVLDISQKYEEGQNWLHTQSHISAERFAIDQLQKDVEWIYKNSQKLIFSAKQGFIAGIIVSMSGVYALHNEELGWINELGMLVLNKENLFRAELLMKDFRRLKPVTDSRL